MVEHSSLKIQKLFTGLVVIKGGTTLESRGCMYSNFKKVKGQVSENPKM